MENFFNVVSIIATIVTAAATIAITYLLQKPYVRVVKLFLPGTGGTQNRKKYKLKNAGAGTAICIVLQDKYGEAIDLDLNLSQAVRSVDALSPGSEITIGIPDSREPARVYYENLFGLLFHTQLTDAANRFWMLGRKTWPRFGRLPGGVRSELPHHWWRRG